METLNSLWAAFIMLIFVCLLISMTCQQSRVQWRTTCPQQSACQCDSLICTTSQMVHDHIGNPENKTVKAIYMPSLTYLYTGINTDDDPGQHTVIAVFIYTQGTRDVINAGVQINSAHWLFWMVTIQSEEVGPVIELLSKAHPWWNHIVFLVCKLWSANSAG